MSVYGETMMFPDTVEQFMEDYKITDTEQIYTNGTELVPIFRMKQWFEHLPSAQSERKKGEWIDTETSYADGVRQECRCSVCSRLSLRPLGDFCRWCGADMRGEMKNEQI